MGTIECDSLICIHLHNHIDILVSLDWKYIVKVEKNRPGQFNSNKYDVSTEAYVNR